MNVRVGGPTAARCRNDTAVVRNRPAPRHSSASMAAACAASGPSSLIIEAYPGSLLRESPCGPDADGRANCRAGRLFACARSSSAFPTSTRCASPPPTTALPRRLALAPPRHVDADRQTRLQVLQVETRAQRPASAAWPCGACSLRQPSRIRRTQARAWRGAPTNGRSTARARCTGPSSSTMSEQERRQLLIALEARHRHRELGAHARATWACRSKRACDVWVHAIDRLLPPTSAEQRLTAGDIRVIPRGWTSYGPNRVDGRRLRSERTRQADRRGATCRWCARSPYCRRRRRSRSAPAAPCARIFERFPDLHALRAGGDRLCHSPRDALRVALRDLDGDRQTRHRLARSSQRATWLRALAAPCGGCSTPISGDLERAGRADQCHSPGWSAAPRS